MGSKITINDKQSEMIDLLIIGNMTKQQIAKSLGVAEKTIYNWINSPLISAELQKRTDVFNSTKMADARNKLAIHLDMAIANIVEIANDKGNSKQYEANKYIIDRNLGGISTKIEQTISDNNSDNNNAENIDTMLDNLDRNNAIEAN